MRKALMVALIMVAPFAQVEAAYKILEGKEAQKAWVPIRTHVAELLIDPESARFQCVSIAVTSELIIATGKVNGRNRYGGYAGARRFSYEAPRSGEREPKVEIWETSLEFTCDSGSDLK